MKNLKFLSVSFFFLIQSVAIASPVCESKGPNAIVITFDGVRPQEFFGKPAFLRKVPKEYRGKKVLEKLWSKYADNDLVYGSTGLTGRFKIGAKLALSLPSYQTIYLGKQSDCTENTCGPVHEETFFDRIWKEFNLSYTDVASIASWRNMEDAVIGPGADFFVHAGLHPKHKLNDDYILMMESIAQNDPPTKWGSAKLDKYTADMSLYYLNKYCPRLLNIAFVDTDEWGHQKSYENYIRSLKTYDDFLDTLFKNLDSLGDYGKNTTVFITTDHGRGWGPFFPKHAVLKKSERNTFLYVRGPNLKAHGRLKTGSGRKSTFIRGTVEKIFGLETKSPYLKEVVP